MKLSRRARTLFGVVAALAIGGALAVQVMAAPTGWLAVDGLIRFNPGGGGTYDWANSGLAGPTGCPAGAIDVGGTGGLFNCGQPGAASAPPTAPTLTPAAAADASIISAVFIVDPIAGDTTPCGTGDPTILTGGKNGDAISSYGFTTGSVPAKDDLSNVYAVSHTRADNGHPEVYFAAERLVNNGDSHIDFEFLQSVVSLAGTCSGAFSGHRTEGDLLTSVDFTTGGTLAGASVYQWHCAAEPGPQPADGTVCDPSGATPPQHYQLVTTPAILTLSVNAATIPCGGWICRDKITGTSTTVAANDFLEGGIDLSAIPFTGCFNSFLPHTRTAQSFSSVLKDFAGPVGFRSCRNPALASTSAPSGGSVAPGSSATDTITAGNGGAGPAPGGSITFLLCGPSQVSGSGCVTGGMQIGAVKPLVAGGATSDPTSATTAAGAYCWRADYAPDLASTGVFAPGTHTNATTECFSVAADVATLPNTGAPELPAQPVSPGLALIVLPVGLVALAWRRSRSITLLLIAGVVAGSSPAPAQPPPAVAGSSGVAQQIQDPVHSLALPTPAQRLDTERPVEAGWRLVIPSIGVDAQIQPVGRDQQGAMASPRDLDGVGWFNQGPSPGQPGDAVIDGHFGLPAQPAVFRQLRELRPGDAVKVVWPDGRSVDFRVASSETVGAADRPAGLFDVSGPARLSLITCAGVWENSLHTYSDRLVVTAVPA